VQYSSADLVAALASGDGVRPPFHAQVFAPLPGGLRGPLTERAVTVDQTNRSVIVGEAVVVKWLAEPVQNGREHPAPRLFAHLTQVGFRDVATPYAAVYRDDALVALVAAYLPDALDGWDWCVDDLLAELSGGTPTAFAAPLGRLAAGLHAALATPSPTFPQPVDDALATSVTTWTARARRSLAEAVELTAADGSADGEWLRSHAEHMCAELDLAGVERTPIMPIHGDLHVGQVLRWRGGLAVTDFDGNPTLAGESGPEPAARDVAQLLTSLEHVARIADKRTGFTRTADTVVWARRARTALLAAYREGLAAAGAGQLLDERLLRACEVEQECRELIYAARFLPRWRYAPMGVLRSWYDVW
jgi:maltokinase